MEGGVSDVLVSMGCSLCGMATSGPWFSAFVGRIKTGGTLSQWGLEC